MRIKDIIADCSVKNVSGDLTLEVNAIVFDSRKAIEGTVFVAIKGTQSDGHQYISNVIQQGCKIIVVQEDFTIEAEGVTVIGVADTSLELGRMAASFYNHPSKEIKLVGITGTNGKTTCVTLLHKLFSKLGYKTGLLSTVVNKIGDKEIPSTHTTPDPVVLNSLLADMVEDGCEYCFMEVSSHAVVQNRIAGLKFIGAVFTNITHDHLDYHGTFKEYIKAKKQFFDHLSNDAFALVNVDDKNGQIMVQNSSATIATYGLKTPCDFKAKILENQFSGLVLSIDNQEVWTRLIGSFNAYNLLVVYGVACLLGQDKLQVLTFISELESVTGRFQYVRSNSGITAIVDYAHTPDALENVLSTIGAIRTKNETVYTIVGCGGDRDKAKRPKMAAIACQMSDRVIITSDNPRSENPDAIIAEMMEGVEGQFYNKTLTITDREQAIKSACLMAQPNDIVLIAGKGHETYQEIQGVKHHFDDMETVLNLFTKLDK